MAQAIQQLTYSGQSNVRKL